MTITPRPAPSGDLLHELLDKQAIREVTLRYCRGVDRCDAELIASAFHPDAIDEHGSSVFTGTTVGEGVLRLVSSSPCSSNQNTNQTIVLHDETTAGCETYYTVWRTVESAGEQRLLMAAGRYLDSLEKRSGEWRISHRRVIIDISHLFPAADVSLSSWPRLGARDRSDPSYAVLAQWLQGEEAS